VKERPILMSGPMVCAILEGRKTMTRRVVQYSPSPRLIFPLLGRNNQPTGEWVFTDPVYEYVGHSRHYCPHGQPGDRLWVKETWQPEGYGRTADVGIKYKADSGYRVFPVAKIPDSWAYPKASTHGNVSPLFMPRWASRITLELTDVRVERLQDISEADARAEGVEPNWCGDLKGWNPEEHGWIDYLQTCEDSDGCGTAKDSFESLWQSINAKRGYGWDKNPWVWVLSFKRVD